MKRNQRCLHSEDDYFTPRSGSEEGNYCDTEHYQGGCRYHDSEQSSQRYCHQNIPQRTCPCMCQESSGESVRPSESTDTRADTEEIVKLLREICNLLTPRTSLSHMAAGTQISPSTDDICATVQRSRFLSEKKAKEKMEKSGNLTVGTVRDDNNGQAMDRAGRKGKSKSTQDDDATEGVGIEGLARPKTGRKSKSKLSEDDDMAIKSSQSFAMWDKEEVLEHHKITFDDDEEPVKLAKGEDDGITEVGGQKGVAGGGGTAVVPTGVHTGKCAELKTFVDSLLCDMHDMKEARQEIICEKFGQRSNDTCSRSCGAAYPVTIKSVRELGPCSLFVRWCTHDRKGIEGYQVFVDGHLTNSYYDPSFTAAVICEIDVNVPHKIVLNAVPQQFQAGGYLDSVFGAFKRKKSNQNTDNRVTASTSTVQRLSCPAPDPAERSEKKWTPSVYFYEPTCPQTAQLAVAGLDCYRA